MANLTIHASQEREINKKCTTAYHQTEGKNLHETTKEEGLHPDDLEMTVTPIYHAAQPVVIGSW